MALDTKGIPYTLSHFAVKSTMNKGTYEMRDRFEQIGQIIFQEWPWTALQVAKAGKF
jgi:hypothetical protein